MMWTTHGFPLCISSVFMFALLLFFTVCFIFGFYYLLGSSKHFICFHLLHLCSESLGFGGSIAMFCTIPFLLANADSSLQVFAYLSICVVKFECLMFLVSWFPFVFKFGCGGGCVGQFCDAHPLGLSQNQAVASLEFDKPHPRSSFGLGSDLEWTGVGRFSSIFIHFD